MDINTTRKKKTKEIKKMTNTNTYTAKCFFKSISGTYYYDEFPYQFPYGYELVTKEEYNEHYRKLGMYDLMVE
jgi:hypothetical protein